MNWNPFNTKLRQLERLRNNLSKRPNSLGRDAWCHGSREMWPSLQMGEVRAEVESARLRIGDEATGRILSAGISETEFHSDGRQVRYTPERYVRDRGRVIKAVEAEIEECAKRLTRFWTIAGTVIAALGVGATLLVWWPS